MPSSIPSQAPLVWAQGSVRPLTEGALCPPASPGTEPVQVKLPQSRASAASPGTACGFLGKADGASAGDYVCGDENTLTSASRTFHVGVVPQCHQRWQAVAVLGLLPALGGAKACVGLIAGPAWQLGGDLSDVCSVAVFCAPCDR